MSKYRDRNPTYAPVNQGCSSVDSDGRRLPVVLTRDADPPGDLEAEAASFLRHSSWPNRTERADLFGRQAVVEFDFKFTISALYMQPCWFAGLQIVKADKAEFVALKDAIIVVGIWQR